MNVVPAPGWDELRERLLALRGTAVFVGRSDSGKSTLVRYLLGEVAAAGIPVALVDGDLGQSFLGLPGSVSSRTFHAAPGHLDLRWDELSFLGAVSPVRVLSLLAAETARFALRTRQEAAVTLVDTTGLVDGPLGRALKLAKLRAVDPQLVVAVNAGDELEPILGALPEERVVRVAPSPLVKRRSAQVRFRYRHARLAAYFHGSREKLLVTRRLVFIHHGKPVHPLFDPPEPGTVVGLNHQGETRGLGVVSEADTDSLVVLTPLSSLRGIDRVVLGDFSFSP
ncbi:Clp1/GlmU family protein [Geomonas sp.]|uniref:Clp1/GlmU family protein n=1 Tax=Geomonas sp. TaxID=2651584 RepID=UPI002B46E54D|nr:Clp1/GlmU family protein [Geomonas sp.]HJV33494.1 Clp1/GlmU family protein [Geomonas sp.]